MDVWPTFPVRYYLIDFGCSVHFTPSSRLDDGLIKSFPITRKRCHCSRVPVIGNDLCAPEMRGLTKHDTFAADIYVAARLFYGFLAVRQLFLYENNIFILITVYCQDIVLVISGFLEFLQDMSSFNPSSRVSATVVLNRLKRLRFEISCQELSQVRRIELTGYHLIPRSFCRSLFEAISAGQFWLACRFGELYLLCQLMFSLFFKNFSRLL